MEYCSEQRDGDDAGEPRSEEVVAQEQALKAADNRVTDPVAVHVDATEANQRSEDDDGERVAVQPEIYRSHESRCICIPARHTFAVFPVAHVAVAIHTFDSGRPLTPE